MVGALMFVGCGDDPQPTQPTGSTSGTGAGGSGNGGNGGDGGAGATGGGGSGGTGGGGNFATYTNPLSIGIPAGGVVENCPDPAIIQGQTPGDTSWYLFCTSDPLNKDDKDGGGKYNEQLIPILKSDDLVTWTYTGNAFTALPSWAEPNAELWAPDIQFFGGKYHLYYVVTEAMGGGSAIGVATSDSPTGPWVQEDAPVVEPHPAPCCSGSKRWVYDPSIVTDDSGKRFIYYGSYYGGISVRELSEDGTFANPLTQTEVVIPNRYEAAYVVKRDQYYYLFGSASNCCNGALSGYSVFVGRSTSPTGPFVDREGVPLMAASVGGTPVLAQNGNRWIGTGHNAVFTDTAGQDWTVYHAVDRNDPYLEDTGSAPALKRQALLDPIDWIDGWPVARGGQGASDTAMPAPAAKQGDKDHYSTTPQANDTPGAMMEAFSDELDEATLGAKWTWVREPAAGTFGLAGGALRMDTQVADLFEDIDNAPVLLREAPAGDYLVETKVTLDVPPEGCCFNFAQAGLVVYKDDDNFIKLASYSNWDTRQVEFAKEMGPVPAGHPRYGAALVGAHAKTLWMRIVKRSDASGERYTAYTSRDGETWVRGATWTHELGADARIGLVAMGAPNANSPFPATFEYVRVHGLQN
ncbi:family 43 glycosylhydrolase [Polyangium aurulentum]|uniref:family 43 glycosylhydrolase n=1 Tax=Polyangium aurulentum TaxID=2567896 RepID=UPI00146A27FD|nr:family 43 glycosylhydrolase [Polyangium aurulentum]UQA56158.1 family 43 glycosylhydrolase [Polyangium aurulentum]